MKRHISSCMPIRIRPLLKTNIRYLSEKDYIKQVYEQLNYYYQMAMGDDWGVCSIFNPRGLLPKIQHACLPTVPKDSDQAGYIEYTDEQDNASRLLFTHAAKNFIN